MRKRYIIMAIIGVGVIGIAAAVYALVSESAVTKKMPACQLVTLADAKPLIGDSAMLDVGSSDPEVLVSAGTSEFSTCRYIAGGAKADDLGYLTIESHYGDAAKLKAEYEKHRAAILELPNQKKLLRNLYQ